MWRLVIAPLLLVLGTSCSIDFHSLVRSETVSTSSISIAPPVANDQSISVSYGKPLSVSLSGTAFGGRIVSGYTVTSGPINGTLTGSPPNLVYSPNARFSGSDSITFKVSDGTTESDVATVNLTVQSGSWIQSALGWDSALAPVMTVDVLNSGIYVAYRFSSSTLTLSNPSGTLTQQHLNASSTGTNVAVGKYTDAGDLEWSLKLSSPTSVNATTLTTDSSGNLIVSGNSVGNLLISDSLGNPLATYTTTGAQDVFIAKISPAGQLLWSRLFTASGSQALRLCRVLNDGSTLIHGTFSGSSLVIESDTSTLSGLSNAGTNSNFIAKLSPTGQVVWARRIGSTGANDASPGLYASETFGVANVVFQTADVTTVSVVDPSNTNLGSTTTGGTLNGVIAASLNLSTGALNWLRVFNAPSSTTFSSDSRLAPSQAFDAGGNFLMSVAANNTSGGWTGTFRLPDGSIVTSFPTIGFGWDHTVFNLSPTGSLIWAVSIRGSSSSTTWWPLMWRDASDNTYIAGTLLSSSALQLFNAAGTQIGTNVTQSSGATSAYIVKLDSSGGLLLETLINKASTTSVTSDDAGNVYWSGTSSVITLIRKTTGTVASLPNSGGQDAYIAKFGTSGSVTWAYNLGSPGTDAVSLRVDPATGNTLMAGTFTSGPLNVKDPTGTTAQSVIASGGATDAFVGLVNDSGMSWINRMSGGAVQISHATSVPIGNTFTVSGSFTASALVQSDSTGTPITQTSGTGSTDIFAMQIKTVNGNSEYLTLPHGGANESLLALTAGTNRLFGISSSAASSLTFAGAPAPGLAAGAWQLFGIQPVSNP